MKRKRSPVDVIPAKVAAALPKDPYWFVIGGQAVRCFCPYRPSHDVDFGVIKAKDSKQLIAHLRKQGTVELLEQSKHTMHFNFEGIDVSVFVLKELAPHVDEGALDVTGVIATKLHALMGRGLRRDFFDLYVVLQTQGWGILDALRALRQVYGDDVNEGLIVRALSYFDDAENEPSLPKEAKDDWNHVKSYFKHVVATLLIPPSPALSIQSHEVGVRSKHARKQRSK